jgi:hypothetical protein
MESSMNAYEAPTVRVLGTLSELTLRNKLLGGPTDGDFLVGYGPLKNAS